MVEDDEAGFIVGSRMNHEGEGLPRSDSDLGMNQDFDGAAPF
jgi:hypothetical protein